MSRGRFRHNASRRRAYRARTHEYHERQTRATREARTWWSEAWSPLAGEADGTSDLGPTWGTRLNHRPQPA